MYKGTNIDSTGKFIFEEDGSISRYIGTETELTIPEYLETKDGKRTQITSIGDGAFSGCNLTSIEMPNVTSIGNNTFSGCDSLAHIEIPNVTSIGERAFYSCDGLTYIEMPNVTSIGTSAFYNCGLKSISIPKITSIGKEVFRDCMLTNVEIPNVTSIGERAFSNCPILSIYMPKVTTIGEYAFESIAASSIEIPNVTSIGKSAFWRCNWLKTVEMPNVVSIGERAFENSYLETMVIPKTTISIGENAFKNTGPGLKGIYIEQYAKANLDEGQSHNGVVVKGECPPVYYLGQYVKIDTNVTRLDANDFNINVLYNGYGEVLTEIKATDQKDETQGLNDIEKRNYVYNIQDLTKLSDKEYKFTGSGKFENNTDSQSKTFSKNIKITGFVNYIDEYGNHLADIQVDKKHYEKGEQIDLTKQIPQGKGAFLGWSLTPNGTSKDIVSTVKMNDTNINLYPVFDTNGKPDTSNTESTSKTTSTTTESSTESTSETVSESSTESTSQTVPESSTESTSQTVTESGTESTSEATSVDNQTETTTNDNQVTPPITDGGNNNNGNNNNGNNGGNNNDNNGGNNNEVDNNTEENVNIQTPNNNVYTFGNLQVITPEYEELAREAIRNITIDREAVNNSIESVLENASNNGAQINERRLTEKPAFGFGAEGNISLFIILLLILILIITAYIVKKQIIDKEKNKNEEDDDEKDNSSLTV